MTVVFGSCLALSIFGVFSLARADLKQNEIAESIDSGEDVVVDLGAIANPTTPVETGTATTAPPTATTVAGRHRLGAGRADDHHHEHDDHDAAAHRTGPVPRRSVTR